MTLQKGLTQAEEDLHNARVALKALETDQDNASKQKILYEAMEKLQGREQEYFARRYFGTAKPILHGWNTAGKQSQFKKKIEALVDAARERVRKVQPLADADDAAAAVSGAAAAADDSPALAAAKACVGACQALKTMNDRWYEGLAGSGARKTAKPEFVDDPTKINTAIRTIEANLAKNEVQASTNSIQDSLRDARICQRLSVIVMSDKWDLPFDLLK